MKGRVNHRAVSEVKESRSLELYGYWQTEPYVPPKVVNVRKFNRGALFFSALQVEGLCFRDVYREMNLVIYMFTKAVWYQKVVFICD